MKHGIESCPISSIVYKLHLQKALQNNQLKYESDEVVLNQLVSICKTVIKINFTLPTLSKKIAQLLTTKEIKTIYLVILMTYVFLNLDNIRCFEYDNVREDTILRAPV